MSPKYTLNWKGTLEWQVWTVILLLHLQHFLYSHKEYKGKICRVLRFWPLIDVIFPLSPHLPLGNIPQRTLDQKLQNFIYLHTSFLTPWSRVLLEKLTCSQLVKKFPAFYRTQRFIITAFTSARHLSLSWARSIQSMPTHPTSWRSILISSSHPRQGLPSGLFPSCFLTKTSYARPLLQTCYMPRPSHSSLFDHPNYIWWVQIIKLLIM